MPRKGEVAKRDILPDPKGGTGEMAEAKSLSGSKAAFECRHDWSYRSWQDDVDGCDHEAFGV
jgi:hypothetical protein